MAVKRSVRLFLQDILDSVVLVRDYMDGLSREDFENDDITKDAVARRIEIIAEASKHIPAALKATRPEIPWPSIRSMRNFLNHEYFAVANESVWNVVQVHLDPLEAAVKAMLANLSETQG